mgnify:FL=1
MTPPFRLRACVAVGFWVLAGCSSLPVVTPPDSMDKLEARLEAQGRQLDWLAQAQRLHREALADNQQELAAAIRETLRAEMPAQGHCPARELPPDDTSKTSCPEQQDLAVDDLDKQVLGQVEHILLTPPELVYRGRVDTGANTASLDARSVEIFERDGDDWARFQVPVGEGELKTLERDVTRYVLISRSGTEKTERRPVVELNFTLGETERRAEFSLTDRGHLDYPVLIGRNILRDLMVVDISREFSASLPGASPRVVQRAANEARHEDEE